MSLIIISSLAPLSQKLTDSGDAESEWEPSTGADFLEWDPRMTHVTAGKDGHTGPVPDSALSSADGPQGSDILCPFRGPIQLAPKKKTVTQWTCCVCGHTGMSVNIPACQYCSTSRCAYCPVERVRVKAVHLNHG
ncbi:hypothetical protein EDB80DRAFT_686179 [Ilyonectria destructans]|nr:hypothetical protein EDB80DRAFT_686179 [Ilyonectria destructans]